MNVAMRILSALLVYELCMANGIMPPQRAATEETRAFIAAIRHHKSSEASRQEQATASPVESRQSWDACTEKAVNYWHSLLLPLNEGCEDGKGLLLRTMGLLDSRRGKVFLDIGEFCLALMKFLIPYHCRSQSWFLAFQHPRRVDNARYDNDAGCNKAGGGL